MSSKSKEDEVIMCIEAHPDDAIFGAGGTISKYHEEGKRIIILTMSYGESSHPWLNKKVTVKTRIKEAKKAHKIVGCDEFYVFGLKDGLFMVDKRVSYVKKVLKKLILEKKPKLIITHSPDDLHPDHTATYSIVESVLSKINRKIDVYTYNVWSPFSFKKKSSPRIYVDITKYFRLKIKAIKCFRSQIVTFAWHPIYWSVYISAFLAGLQSRKLFAEVFYKIK